ncbi:MAG: ABC transporter ATP-binding protein [Chloroflexi bacterium]|nr:MAG: ABC transporter ATP-binding protein [Chloroflexota bacterium]
MRDLVVEYSIRQGSLRAVDGASLDVHPGELMAVVGESGCGKSTLAYSIIRHVPYPGEIKGGTILFDGQDVLGMDRKALRQFRWKEIAIVFQAAQNALNPVMRIADQMIDTVLDHEKQPKEQIIQRASSLLEMVRLNPDRVLRSYPFELSGGMRQRVIIALSLLLNPRMLILDEPTTALDVVTQVYILDILADIRQDLGLAMMLLTHDIAIVARVADRVAVMYAGQIVEEGAINDIFYHPRHPYTYGLIQSAPSLIGDLTKKKPIEGAPPNFLNMPSGCRFHPRCAYATSVCREKEPVMEATDRWRVACHRWREIKMGE